MPAPLRIHPLLHAEAAWDSELCLVRAPDRAGLAAAIDEAVELARFPGATLARVARTLVDRQPDGRACLSIVARDAGQFSKKALHARKRLTQPECTRIQDRSGIFYTDEPQYEPGRLGLLFPGEGCQYPGMLRELCLHFPEVRHAFDLVDRACRTVDPGFTPSTRIFEGPLGDDHRELWSMGAAVEAVSAADTGMMRLFQGLEISADAVVGHSSGEYVALEMAGVLHFANDDEHLALIRDGYRNIQTLEMRADIPEGRLIAVGGLDEEHVLAVLEAHPGKVLLAMHNCPHQFVLCAEPGLVDDVCAALGGKGAMVQPLPFHRPYHTSWFEPALDGIRGLFEGRTLHTPTTRLYSCATAGRFPDDEEGIRGLCVQQWTSRVRFADTVKAMHEDGIRIFLDVGPRGNLAAFVQDILKGQPHLAVAANRQHRSSITQLHHALGQLAAQGVPMRLDYLHHHRKTEPLLPGSAVKPDPPGIQLAPVLPRLDAAPRAVVRQPVTSSHLKSPAPDSLASTAMHAYFDTMDRFIQTQRNLVSRFLDDQEPPAT